jgi:aminopeptidase-like protein
MGSKKRSPVAAKSKTPDANAVIGQAMHRLIQELYPICRSITGDGFRRSLEILSRHIPLAREEVPTGTAVFDWTVPKEWNIRDAFIKDASGRRVVDFRAHTLHILNYSVPVHERMTLSELRPRLYTLPEKPDLIPYRTSYYKETWGFCLSQRQLDALREGEYEVCVESTLTDGHLTYGEFFLKGETDDEVLISCHSCHPSLCNDNLSGMALSVFLAEALRSRQLWYSYRFLFIPGAIGAITWLARNAERARAIQHGLVVACVGDPGNMTYKKSRRGNAEIDRAVIHVLQNSGRPYSVREFSPYGYDERQYCSPGFNLAVGALSRTPHGEFPEYHTSADNPDFVRPEALQHSLETYLEVVQLLEANRTYRNLNPHCEPQLGKRGLYTSMGGYTHSPEDQMALLWVLNLSDGSHSLLDIAERSGMKFSVVKHAADRLLTADLLAEVRR